MDAEISRIEAKRRKKSKRDKLNAYIERGRARRIRDTRSDDEILGYDEYGIPS